ncbi:hypothetical protein OPV22_030412 [Ensete ventricosum]|uniref:Uncharacterized protein n=1 Tax=Ensete ventricosum TaxID=4639 RepID=A0AAV8Q8X9_ENSVE|nr:hypothetical protein OPV22_030412 [Ensete ventricosum]
MFILAPQTYLGGGSRFELINNEGLICACFNIWFDHGLLQHWRGSAGGRSSEENKMEIHHLGEKKGKEVGNPSLATKNANNGKDKYNKCDGDPVAHTQGMSMDTHHQISIDDFRRMADVGLHRFGYAYAYDYDASFKYLKLGGTEFKLINNEDVICACFYVWFGHHPLRDCNEEAKKDIDSNPGEKKVKAVKDASPGYHFGTTKDAENDKMFDVSTMSRTRPTDNDPHHSIKHFAKSP